MSTQTDADNDNEIKSYNELHRSDQVRSYRADGHLYAYRDGDQHVVVSRGREHKDQWTDRIPAERADVDPGEQLWTIPDNWRRVVHIKDDGTVYKISSTGEYVHVKVPRKTRVCDAWYRVARVGTMRVTCADGCVDLDALKELADSVVDLDWVSDDAIETIQSLAARGDELRRAFETEVSTYGRDALLMEHGTPTYDGWTTDPGWIEATDVSRVCEQVVDTDVDDDVVKLLSTDVLPLYPPVTIEIITD